MFTHIKKYRQFVNNDAVVVHRINECDEKIPILLISRHLKQTDLRKCNFCMSVGISSFFISQGLIIKSKVIKSEILNKKYF